MSIHKSLKLKNSLARQRRQGQQGQRPHDEPQDDAVGDPLQAREERSHSIERGDPERAERGKPGERQKDWHGRAMIPL